MWQPLGGLSHEKRRTPPGTPKTIGVRELWRFLCLLQFPATGMFLYGPSSKCRRASSLFFTPILMDDSKHLVGAPGTALGAPSEPISVRAWAGRSCTSEVL